MLFCLIFSGLMGTGHGIFLFLPLAHSFARLIAYAVLPTGGDLSFPTVPDRRSSRFVAKNLFADIQASAPEVFPTVPRILEKIMGSLASLSAGSANGSFQTRLVQTAMHLYRELSPLNKSGELWRISQKLQWAFAKIVIARVRARVFGKSFRYAISGGAPLSIEVLKFFELYDIRIYEGYGLTETTPALAANTAKFRKIGTVGRPFPGIELKIAEDGEILLRGGNIALGYWRRPKATAEAWLPGGWFATGDIGEIDEEGYLKITDRKKELIVNAGGKKIAPAFIEGRLKSSQYISSAFAFGDKKPFLVALLTLDLPSLEGWIKSHSLTGLPQQQLIEKPELIALIDEEIKRANEGIASYEQIRKFKLLAEDFTVDNGLLTPTLKLRRKAIVSKYQAEIDELYR